MGTNDIVIVSGVRMAVGDFGGSLKDISAQDLGTLVIKEAVTRVGISPEAVGEVIIGQVGQITEDGFVGRAVSLETGLPQETTAYSVNRQCGSGLQAIAEAVMGIQTEQADICVARGTEDISKLPYYIRDARWGARMGYKVFEGRVIDVPTWSLGPYHSGIIAENVTEQCRVNREKQDAFTLESHRRTVQAIKAGKFKDEIVPVELEDRKGSITIFDTDEGPREGLTIREPQKLGPCFARSGVVAAGDASSLNDRAGAVVIMSGEKAKGLGCKPLLTIKGYAATDSGGAVTGYTPKLSNEKLTAKLGLGLTSIDMVETNEAFASQAYAVKRDLGLDPERTDIYGDRISIGHPIGATGVILAVKTMCELQRTDKKDAMVSMCIGGGQGISIYFAKSG